MRQTHLSLPELALIAGTRGALGFGLGLLLADHFSPQLRRVLGCALFTVGAVSTIPLASRVLGRLQAEKPMEMTSQRFAAASP